jgi:excisionase family DNA binding protein
MLTTAQAAKLLGVTDVRVRHLCQEGRLGSKVGRDWVITEEEIERFERKPPHRPKKEPPR